jgi:hypothetical protein
MLMIWGLKIFGARIKAFWDMRLQGKLRFELRGIGCRDFIAGFLEEVVQ